MQNVKNAAAALGLGLMLGSGTPARAQNVDVRGDTAGSTAQTLSGTKENGDNPAAGKATPVTKPARADNRTRALAAHNRSHIMPKPPRRTAGIAGMVGDESGVAPSADTKNATPQTRAAESTAHKTVRDPNNELGTSLQGGMAK